MSILEFKQTYNNWIAREHKAERFFDNPDVEQSKKDSWLPEFMTISENLSLLIAEYRKITGVDMNEDDVLNGFQ